MKRYIASSNVWNSFVKFKTGLTYEFTTTGDCTNTFKLYSTPRDAVESVSYEKGVTEIFEVEPYNCIGSDRHNNLQSKKIKILRLIPTDEFEGYEFDKHGNISHIDYGNDNFQSWEYDDNDNLIYYEESNKDDGSGEVTLWEKHERNEDGNVVLFESSNGEWRKYEYENGRLKHTTTSDGFYEDNYYKNGKKIFKKNSFSTVSYHHIKGEGYTRIYSGEENYVHIKKYDQKSNLLSFSDSLNFSEEYEYNKKGDLVFYKDSNDFWKRNSYDENGRLIRHENSAKYWRNMEYDSNGNLTKRVNSNGRVETFTYNSEGVMIAFSDNKEGSWSLKITEE